MQDDYPNIVQALDFGPIQGLPVLFSDSIFRLRATSYWALFAMWSAFGDTSTGYHLVSLALHFLSTLLVYRLAQDTGLGAGAFFAALFFASHEGHQEAVIWLSAINELLLFVFGASAVICWRKADDHPAWHGAALMAFVLATLSKESAVILPCLFVLVRKPKGWDLAPYGLISAAAVASALTSSTYSFRFTDGSFSLSAPFLLTAAHSLGRLLWPWGFAALAILVWRHSAKLALFPFAWMLTGLLPYCFLTYSTAIPSRQTYLASAGLALLAGAALREAAAMMSRRAFASLLVALLAVNAGILWTKKQRQFLERAAPTERLRADLRRGAQVIHGDCYQVPAIVVRDAIRLMEPSFKGRIVTGQKCTAAGAVPVK